MMRYLLDTCALIWLGMGGGELSNDAKQRIKVASELHYSSISAWEITRLQKEGKVVIPNTPDGFLADLEKLYGLSSILPDDNVMIRAAQLPNHHKDPADRIIIATAFIHDLVIITADAKFSLYGIRTLA